MKIQNNVIMAGLQLPMRKVLIEADLLWESLGEELIITSALDGLHKAGSYHYYGYALDFKTHHFNRKQIIEMVVKLRQVLGRSYTVIQYETHIHVQFNANRTINK